MRLRTPASGGSAPPARRTFQVPSRAPTTHSLPQGARPKRPLPAHGGRARLRAADRRRLAVRAEVGRLPRRARERRRRAGAVVAQGAAAAALLPRAATARRPAPAPLRARRRDRDRARRRPRLRLDADAPEPGGEPPQQARRREPRPLSL